MRSVVLISLLAMLAACGQPQQQSAPPTAPDEFAGMPSWARDYVGKPISETFPTGSLSCVGFVDGADKQHAPIRITGWGWDRSASRGYDAVISVGADGTITGAGTTTTDRPDVLNSLHGVVTSPRVGYEVVTTATTGVQAVYGVDLTAHTACSFGSASL